MHVYVYVVALDAVPTDTPSCAVGFPRILITRFHMLRALYALGVGTLRRRVRRTRGRVYTRRADVASYVMRRRIWLGIVR